MPRSAAERKELYYQRKAAGICVSCESLAEPGRNRCQRHLMQACECSRRYVIHKTAGICVGCSNPAEPGRHRCHRCLTQRRESYRRRRAAKGAPTAAPRPILIQPDDPRIKFIALTRGQVVVVDADQYEGLMKWRWCAHWERDARSFYAVRGRRTKKPCLVYLHRQLLGEPKWCEVDHINGDSLDCRLSNLRLCTHAQNQANRRPSKNNSSGCRGVSWSKANCKWRARIMVNRREIPLGYFVNKSDAIAARQAAERQYYGEFAYAARADASQIHRKPVRTESWQTPALQPASVRA